MFNRNISKTFIKNQTNPASDLNMAPDIVFAAANIPEDMTVVTVEKYNTRLEEIHYEEMEKINNNYN